ncbi:ADP-ribose pyrophosphatase YjhB (NUDIX family) [Pseudomonas sp. URMO17WK12:I1]|uniref:NUDIX domain-containing protein n=1 Tax=unclassified Pseudomonas TaxID=196821 RepID=UPI000486541A|nr:MULTISPECIES: NUDIX domain-containing protein [unclassified Pseudomonas]PZW65915.1 ADP-ribose pyrophosphatase YjhB (NUDIX family) [Pseudomonas sp. URMO17WK12:I1]
MNAQPRLGCGAAIVQGDRLLLVRRLREPEAGCWGLPGGKLDWLEPVEQAVRREIEEELAIRLTSLCLLCVVDQIDAQRGEHWLAPVYLADTFDGEVRNVEPEKHSDIGWFALDGLPEPLTVATRKAARALNERRLQSTTAMN